MSGFDRPFGQTSHLSVAPTFGDAYHPEGRVSSGEDVSRNTSQNVFGNTTVAQQTWKASTPYFHGESLANNVSLTPTTFGHSRSFSGMQFQGSHMGVIPEQAQNANAGFGVGFESSSLTQFESQKRTFTASYTPVFMGSNQASRPSIAFGSAIQSQRNDDKKDKYLNSEKKPSSNQGDFMNMEGSKFDKQTSSKEIKTENSIFDSENIEKEEESTKKAQRLKRFLPVRMSSALASQAERTSLKTKDKQISPPVHNESRLSDFVNSGEEMDVGEFDDQDKPQSTHAAIVGTCEEMCPIAEIERRQNMSDIQLFERVDPNNASASSVELAVKRFARTIDDPQPSDFRTRDALSRTMIHLSKLLDRTDVRFGLIHKFLWDRYRSVRQDLYIQGIDDEFGIRIFEEIVRFHVLCEHELCGEDQSVTNMEGFNSHLNLEQMNKALISLSDMYDKAAANGKPAPNEAEFRAYHLLSMMSQHGKYKGDQQSFLSTLQGLRPNVLSSAHVQWVLRLRAAFFSGNFIRFFSLIVEAPYLSACLAHTYFGAIRSKGLKSLSETLSTGAARPGIVEVSWLKSIFLLDSDQDVLQLCRQHGFVESFVDSESGETSVRLIKGAYVDPPPPVQKNASEVIRKKARDKRSIIVQFPTQYNPRSAAAKELEGSTCISFVQDSKDKEEGRGQRKVVDVKPPCVSKPEINTESISQSEKQILKDQLPSTFLSKGEIKDELATEKEQLLKSEATTAKAFKMEEARRRQELLAQKKLLEENAHRLKEQEQARIRQEAMVREKLAEEVKRQKEREEMKRRQEEEMRKKYMEELERREREEKESKRKEEEAERQRLEEICSTVLRLRFSRKWVKEARRRIENRRRKERMNASLKLCRVGIDSHIGEMRSKETLKESYAGKFLSASRGMFEKAIHKIAKKKQHGLDLTSVVLKASLDNRAQLSNLFWKISIIDATGSTHNLFTQWVDQHLTSGKLDLCNYGKNFIQESQKVLLHKKYVKVKICVSLPKPLNDEVDFEKCMEWSTRGSSGIIILVSNPSPNLDLLSGLKIALNKLPELPVLFVSPDDESSHCWMDVWQSIYSGSSTSIATRNDEYKLQSLNQEHKGSFPHLPLFSKQSLVDGLLWLASKSPCQPDLETITLEDLLQNLFFEALKSFECSASSKFEGYFAALDASITSVLHILEVSSQSVEKEWQWPPTELCSGFMKEWHKTEYIEGLVASLLNFQNKAKKDVMIQQFSGNPTRTLMHIYDSISSLSSGRYTMAVLPPAAKLSKDKELCRLRINAVKGKENMLDDREMMFESDSSKIASLYSSAKRKRDSDVDYARSATKHLTHVGNKLESSSWKFRKCLKRLKSEIAREMEEQSSIKLGLDTILGLDQSRDASWRSMENSSSQDLQEVETMSVDKDTEPSFKTVDRIASLKDDIIAEQHAFRNLETHITTDFNALP